MNDWEMFHYPWYLEVEGWTIAFDQVEKIAYKKNQSGQSAKVYFNDVKLGSEKYIIAEKIVEDIGAAMFTEAILDMSRKAKLKAKHVDQ